MDEAEGAEAEPSLSKDSKAPKEGAIPTDTGTVTKLQRGTDEATNPPYSAAHCPTHWGTRAAVFLLGRIPEKHRHR